MRTAIMQKDDWTLSPFVLQWEPTLEEAKEKAFRLAMKRDREGNQWPKWNVNGITY